MLLSEAIVIGSMKKPQAFGKWFEGSPQEGTVVSTCAIAAAMDAIGEFDKPWDQNEYKDVSRLWPYLAEMAINPCNKLGSCIGLIMQYLNDIHRWTRPQIAAWVAEQEVRLGIVDQVEVVEKEVALEAV